MTEHVISGLVKKRSELAGELDRLRADLRAIDRALIVFGHDDPKSIKAANKRRNPTLFKSGEVIALVGQAEREGLDNNPDIADWILRKKGWSASLYKRVWNSVKDCRKRFKGTDIHVMPGGH